MKEINLVDIPKDALSIRYDNDKIIIECSINKLKHQKESKKGNISKFKKGDLKVLKSTEEKKNKKKQVKEMGCLLYICSNICNYINCCNCCNKKVKNGFNIVINK